MVPSEIRSIIENFIKAIKQQGIKIESVILFGSFAKGSQQETSDIDIAVISADFGKDRFEESKLLQKIAWRVDVRIEPIPLSVDALNKDDWVPLIHEIKTNGLKLDIAA